jgi:hypothetical protein
VILPKRIRLPILISGEYNPFWIALQAPELVFFGKCRQSGASSAAQARTWDANEKFLTNFFTLDGELGRLS